MLSFTNWRMESPASERSVSVGRECRSTQTSPERREESGNVDFVNEPPEERIRFFMRRAASAASVLRPDWRYGRGFDFAYHATERELGRRD